MEHLRPAALKILREAESSTVQIQNFKEVPVRYIQPTSLGLKAKAEFMGIRGMTPSLKATSWNGFSTNP